MIKLADTLYNSDGTLIGNATGINQLTGDVTAGPGSGSQVATIAANAVTTGKINNGAVTEAKQTLADNTTGNVTSSAHGYTPKSPADNTQFLNGGATPAFSAVTDADLSTSDITTNNVSITKHGFAPKAPNVATEYLDGTGNYSTPAGSGNVSTTGSPASGNLTKFTGTTTISNADLTGDVTTSGGVATTLKAAAKTRAIQATVNGGGSVPSTGVFADVYVPYACTITAATMLADQSGSAVIDIWVSSSLSTTPTVANTITASDLPTLSSAIQSNDTTLTGWTTSISAGSWVRFNLNSVTTCTRVQVTLTVTT